VLGDAGYFVVTAGTRRTALAKVAEAHPVVVVLDTPSLRFKCMRLCQELQESYPGVPTLALLPTGAASGDGAYADARLKHPVSDRKLIRRVEQLRKRLLQVGDVIYCVKQRFVPYGNSHKRLTPKQGRLLELLMRHRDQVLTRAFLMKRVWDTEYMGDTRTLYVHIRKVREAIEEDPSSPVYLRTVRGVGYRFGPPDEP
jgi:two-component system alkaline phosphatase synthesis response regulator PhoP